MGCSNLVGIELPDNLETIGCAAFQKCTKLDNVVVPASTITIEERAFSWCEGMTSIVLPEGLATIGTNAFYECLSLKQVIMPNTVTTLGEGVFSGCSNLIEITLPGGVATLSDYRMFNGCNKLEKVTLGDGIKSVNDSLFYYASALKELTLPGTLTTVNRNVSCATLEELTLSEGITTISSGAFANCTKIQTVIIPRSVSRMYTDSFAANTVLLVYEDSYAHRFAIDYDLLYFVYDGVSEPNIVVQDGITYCITVDEAIAICFDNSLSEVVLPSEISGFPVTQIRAAFRNCTALISVTLPETVVYIGEYSFQGCTALTTVNIPETVTQIGRYAFHGCQALEAINVPGSLSFLGEYCFYGCSAMVSADIGDGTYDILPHTFSGCSSLTGITLNEGVKAIGENAFYCCSSLKSINIPSSVAVIGKQAFRFCDVLSEIVFSEGLESIGELAFGSSGIIDLDLPDSLATIGAQAFQFCWSLENVTLPDGPLSIGWGAFQDCAVLTSITIPGGVGVIDSSAFKDCGRLTNVIIEEGVTEIAHNAFDGCRSLSDVALPEGLKVIAGNGFIGCGALRYVYIPGSVSELETNSFETTVIYVVKENSYAHTFAAENGLLYFVLHKTSNPEVEYGASLSGTVTYTDGTPAAGVSVEIFYDDGVSKETVVTDENGVYEFTYAEVGAYTVRAADSDGNTFTTLVSIKRMNAFDVFVEGDTDLTLKKGYKVSGTVSVGGATVTVTDQSANVITSVTADEDGSFVIENLPNGTYIITAVTEQGSASAEITVFDGDLSDISLTIATDVVTLWGYVEVEDREYNHHRRNWVQVTVYNEEGIAVAQCKSDSEGKYTFSGLPAGEYSIVAETAELRPDRKHGFDRSHTLTGYAYVSACETGEYEVDTIVLYEENDHTATIEGKVTVNGQSNASEVRLVNVFRHEVAEMTTGSNGKYSFTNVKDGLYYIIATTDNYGMGMTVVTVRNGKIYGNTDIKVYKSDKIKDREDRFKEDIPECDSKDGILSYRERIAEEKRFYDGLSEKEKKQLSKDYVERLNRYCEWLADIEYTADDDVKVEGGGLILSGDELEGEDTVSFDLNVEKKEAYTASTDGVYDRDDFIAHRMNDTAGDQDVVQYYEITMTKTVDGEERAITSVYKDTDATGKFRITVTIPEEYRGHAQYTMLHEHHGEVVTLADLDDDPNTITVEVDRFSTFALTATDESNIGEVGVDTGDANADGVINILDMTVTARYIAQGGASGTYDLSACDTEAMDANSDGVIDQLDLNAIAAIIRANA